MFLAEMEPRIFPENFHLLTAYGELINIPVPMGGVYYFIYYLMMYVCMCVCLFVCLL